MLKKRKKYTPKTLINTDVHKAKGTCEDWILLMWFSVWSGVTIPDAFSAYIAM
jgi:hypothetical protein